MNRILHIVNPVNSPSGSELSLVQPITYETIRAAKSFAAVDIRVEICAVCFNEDLAIVPDFCEYTGIVHRSVRDVEGFASKKKLPFINDILSIGASMSDAEWLIYTNADICVMPHFYLLVNEVIKQGHDATLITRRRISKEYKSVTQIPLMYSEIGGYHPGYDCFIFHRSLLDKFVLGNICIGVPFIEVSLLHNFIAYASSLRHIDDLHLTFHIGMEVMPPVDGELYQHNRREYEMKILPKLKPQLDIKNFPNYGLPFHKRMMKGILNPCYSSALLLELEGKNILRKGKILIDELRWKIISR